MTQSDKDDPQNEDSPETPNATSFIQVFLESFSDFLTRILSKKYPLRSLFGSAPILAFILLTIKPISLNLFHKINQVSHKLQNGMVNYSVSFVSTYDIISNSNENIHQLEDKFIDAISNHIFFDKNQSEDHTTGMVIFDSGSLNNRSFSKIVKKLNSHANNSRIVPRVLFDHSYSRSSEIDDIHATLKIQIFAEPDSLVRDALRRADKRSDFSFCETNDWPEFEEDRANSAATLLGLKRKSFGLEKIVTKAIRHRTLSDNTFNSNEIVFVTRYPTGSEKYSNANQNPVEFIERAEALYYYEVGFKGYVFFIAAYLVVCIFVLATKVIFLFLRRINYDAESDRWITFCPNHGLMITAIVVYFLLSSLSVLENCAYSVYFMPGPFLISWIGYIVIKSK